jgi:hypothetical protein
MREETSTAQALATLQPAGIAVPVAVVDVAVDVLVMEATLANTFMRHEPPQACAVFPTRVLVNKP